MKINILLICLFIGLQANSAPMPGTSTSQLVSPELGLHRSSAGFTISSAATKWQQATPPKESKFIEALYKSPENGKLRGTLTVRVDRDVKEKSLDLYMKKWMKEYPRFGFDVTGSKPFKMAKKEGYVVDLVNREKNRQLRQVVFLKNGKAVILTCRDQSEEFKESLNQCNDIVKTFAWNNSDKTK